MPHQGQQVHSRHALTYTAAARALRTSLQAVKDLIRTGALTASRDEWGRPVVPRAEVELLAATLN